MAPGARIPGLCKERNSKERRLETVAKTSPERRTGSGAHRGPETEGERVRSSTGRSRRGDSGAARIGIDSWCKENSYVIAGYYQANERVKDASPNQVAEKVASRIAEGFNDAVLIMVDNSKFTMECLHPIIHAYEHHDNRWRGRDIHSDFCEDWLEAQRIAASLLDSRSYEYLVDFDNHLDDIRHDWTNPEINKAILHLC
ncbi:ER membrane protein complex subunit 8 isoform X2 [Rhinatrema bivittatum]|uniref:ER membrane protein complex subunit 8 isoform X2 n=1 Tax=Rhinatrema bivittatum TaxID=194408 RepID=UPI00112D32BD|nr:ER membrane protein complex subunit 8 isoform X2 [Rhinatrema bivittatum]